MKPQRTRRTKLNPRAVGVAGLVLIVIAWFGYYVYYTYPIQAHSTHVQGSVIDFSPSLGRFGWVSYTYEYEGASYTGTESGPMADALRTRGMQVDVELAANRPWISTLDLQRLIMLRQRTMYGAIVMVCVGLAYAYVRLRSRGVANL